MKSFFSSAFPPSVAASYCYGFEAPTGSAYAAFACWETLGTKLSSGRPLVADVEGDDGPDIEGLCRPCARLPKRQARRKRGTKRLSLLVGALCVLVWACVGVRAQTVTTLASFNNNGNGSVSPNGELIMDPSGNLWGTSYYGGSYNNGTIFEYTTATQTLNTLYSFGFGASGSNPSGGLTPDGKGDYFGVTAFGGAYGFGTVYEITPANGRITTIANLSINNASPNGPPAIGQYGDIYVTTLYGGLYYQGSVTQISHFNGEYDVPRVVVSFANTSGSLNSVQPNGGLALGGGGNLYGTTVGGGTANQGTIFSVAADVLHNNYTLSTLASIPGGVPPGYGGNGVIIDATGNLYGAASSAIFEVDAATHTLTFLANLFNLGGSTSGLAMDANGNLFGTTNGSVYELDRANDTLVVLANWSSSAGPLVSPVGGVLPDNGGHLYGTGLFGGSTGEGNIFEIAVPEPKPLPLIGAALLISLSMRRHKRGSSTNKGKATACAVAT